MLNTDYQKLLNILNSDISPLNTINSIFTNQLLNVSLADLSPDAALSLTIPNAGGSSDKSEALSIDMLIKYYQAYNIILENKVPYRYVYKMVDYICSIGDIRIGVSVTRAMGHYCNLTRDFDPDTYSQDDADALLAKKLKGLCLARNCVDSAYCFYTAVLHIFCQSGDIANKLMVSYKNLNPDIYDLNGKDKCRFIILLTVSNSDIIYSNYYN